MLRPSLILSAPGAPGRCFSERGKRVGLNSCSNSTTGCINDSTNTSSERRRSFVRVSDYDALPCLTPRHVAPYYARGHAENGAGSTWGALVPLPERFVSKSIPAFKSFLFLCSIHSYVSAPLAPHQATRSTSTFVEDRR